MHARRPRPAAMALACGLLLAATSLGPGVARSTSAAPAPPVAKGRGEGLAKALCVSCHKLSPPDVLPRASWRATIEKMVLFVEGKAAPEGEGPRPSVPLSPEYQAILEYYEAAAPAELPAPAAWPAPDARAPQFVRHPIAFAGAVTAEPAVANVLLADVDGDARPELLACDMRQGAVLLARPYQPEAGAALLAQVPHPDHVSVLDLDGDGTRDLLIADLGEFYPGDHERGAVTLLRAQKGGGYVPFTISGFPRVADAEAADVDGDGKLDVVVAGFGWHKKGGITLLRNRTQDWSQPLFDRTALDARAGAIHVILTDIDGDGRLDVMALIAQEHESVVAFLGDGKGAFAKAQTLYAAPHPNWGSSGIQLVDFDKDGDLDVLATNGDMFDDQLLKPYHGLQWLENKGRLRFEAHPLAPLAGAHRALAVDLDGDGDLDVVASAFTSIVSGPIAATLPSLVWLEQVKGGRFERHTLAVGSPDHATLDAGDVDGDGDVDIVTGAFRLRGASDHWLEVWENRKVSAPGPAAARPGAAPGARSN